MAYPHYMMEVPMMALAVSTSATDGTGGGGVMPTAAAAHGIPPAYRIALGVGGAGGASYTVTNGGAGAFTPLCVPHKVHRVGVRLTANPANPQDLIFWKRIEGGATGWVTGAPIFNPTGEMFRMMLPTIGATGKAIWKNVTGNYIVRPGESLVVGVSAVLSSVDARIHLLVSPAWDEPGNVTSMSQTTAP